MMNETKALAKQADDLIRADAARWRRGEYLSGCSLIVRLLISVADPSMIATCRAALSGSESAIEVCAMKAVQERLVG